MVLFAAIALAPTPGGTARASADPVLETPAIFAPALGIPPLDTLRVTGGFGEVRSNHFHAGFDFSTGGRVGRPVRAPRAGTVERVRSSGVGYGRSVYLRTDDGRLLVFGHLDAYAPALAACIDSAQRAAGQYEQDLWPAPGRLRFAAGDTLAWSGQSGAGGPHLHVEIRHGDFAVHPLRGGLPCGPLAAPRLATLTLEPLDPLSKVAGGFAPRTSKLHAGGDTVEVEGRVRAVVRSVSGLGSAGDSPAWSTAMTWEGATVEARLDSISWAGEMSEIDEVIDRGRIAGSGGLMLWAPAGFRPRFLRTSVPIDSEAGTIEVLPGSPPRTLRLLAREPGGGEVERLVVLRPPGPTSPAATTPRPSRASRLPHKAGATVAPPRWSFGILPGPNVRVRVAGVPPDVDSLRIERANDERLGAPATWDGSGWCAVVSGEGLPDGEGFWIKGRHPDGTAWWNRAAYKLWPAGADITVQPEPGMRVPIGLADVFEYGIVLTQVLPRVEAPAQGLASAGLRMRVWPEDLPLRRALKISLPLAPDDSARGLGLYRRRGTDDWEWVGARFDSATRSLAAETSALGDFALMRDAAPPLVRLQVPARRAPAGRYSRWQLVANVSERGSGLDASASAFFVDGIRVPTEWDAEMGVLRWRPLVAPAPGSHRVEVRATDRAGNAASRRATFVLDSARH
jgi:hypothetical protein